MTAELLGLGVDVCRASRWRRSPAVVTAAFTDRERAWAGGDPPRLALVWAVKEALVKALGCGFGGLGWRDVEVDPGPRGLRLRWRRCDELPAWAGEPGLIWRACAGLRSSVALAVVCLQRGSAPPRIAIAAGETPLFGAVARRERRRLASAAARRAAHTAAARLLPGVDCEVVRSQDGPPALRGPALPDDARVSLSHCGPLVAAAAGYGR